MDLDRRRQLHAYLFWAVVLGLLLLSAFIALPFIGAIISAYILAYLAKPLFLKLKPRLGVSIAALLCIVTAILLIVIPICLISIDVLNQVKAASHGQGVGEIIDTLAAQPMLKSVNVDSTDFKAWANEVLDRTINSAVQSIPSFAIGILITINGMFYLLCNWDELAAHLKKYLPFKDNGKIITKLSKTADAIIRGNVIVSLLEAVIAFVGFYLLGIQASLIFAVLILIFAFMPSVGTELIWGAMALYYFLTNQYMTMWGVLAIGLILWIGIEFFFAARFVGSRARIHPFILLIGVLGGIAVFGIFGFIIGPLLLATSITIVESAIESHSAKPEQREKPAA
ncbi:TPA: AI-2E family transporter [Candidatus Micrarchaeota archaeon]|nr:MAG: hypothetical protein AUJ65_01210 [Candidatus Micrarchaeota archaeon CG1_02_51_15]HII38954.1 AI-2E family transporter [Candidatus Micrarchaeota archaeon]